jgi:hypothetical protein
MIFSNDFGLEGFNYFLIVNSVVLDSSNGFGWASNG